MREPEEVDCPHAYECFGDGGPWGKGAFDDPLSNAAGSKPWMECHCMTEEERKELGRVRRELADAHAHAEDFRCEAIEHDRKRDQYAGLLNEVLADDHVVTLDAGLVRRIYEALREKAK